MNYEFEDCYDEIENIETEIDDKVLKDIQQKKQKIKRQIKKIKNKDKDE
jgi:ribosome-binding ATPase YchF (GTP1/OBG family)